MTVRSRFAFARRRLGKLTRGLKRKRVELFVRLLGLGPGDRVLDLGSEAGAYLSAYYPHPQNIVLADIDEEPMRRGVARFGLAGYRVIPADGPLPFRDAEFDAVWCNSCIEHVTLGRPELGRVSDREFRARADQHQRQFASEVERIARRYFVQTPFFHFPIESHAWLPFMQYLPQESRFLLSQRLKPYWIKQWTADFLLYDMRRFRDHFPGASAIRVERVCGIPKSLIAIRSE